MLPPCFDLSPRSNFEECLWPLPPTNGRGGGVGAQPLPMFTTPVHCGLWETLIQQCSSPEPATLSVGRYARYVCSAQLKFGDLGSLCAQQPSLTELPCKFKLYPVCSYLPDFIKLQSYFKKLSF